MNNYQEATEQCQLFSKGFDAIEGLIMEWGRNKGSLKKNLKEILSSKESAAPEYGSFSAGNYLLSLMLTNSKEMRQFATQNETLLSASAKQALSYWREHPAFWLFFSIQELHKDNFITIKDLLSGEEHLLSSKGIVDMQRREETRNKHYLCLMLPNGKCLQTCGIIRYNALTSTDLLYYLSCFDAQGSLDSVINNHYPTFFKLDELSNVPVIFHKEERMLFIYQRFQMADFSISKLPGTWETKVVGNLRSYSLIPNTGSSAENSEISLRENNATLYHDTQTGEMAISTLLLSSYTQFSTLLTHAYPQLTLPLQPEIAISMVLMPLLEKLKFDVAWAPFSSIIQSKKEPNPKLEPFNLLLKAYTKSRNEGKLFDVKQFCKETGMDFSEAENLVSMLDAKFEQTLPSFKVSPQDKQYELTGYPIPSPVQLRPFASGLDEAGVFDCDDDDTVYDQFETLTQGSFEEELEDIDLVEFTENLFTDAFGFHLGYTLMHSFFWILHYKGFDYLPVRSYALEMLKMFPYPLGQAFSESEEFIETFSRFTKKILCTRGFCQLKSRPTQAETVKGTYLIKATDLFYSFLQPMHS